MHTSNDLICLFQQTFASFNTQLVSGDNEPIYLPADDNHSYHRIVFAHGFYASAMHEIAHWCLAGEQRRKLVDYGYWYCPDGRDEKQQAIFEQVEIKPQAIEWAFCAAAGFKFDVSLDNVSGITNNRFAFKHNVYQQVLLYLYKGFPARAALFIESLQAFYRTEKLTHQSFDYPELNQHRKEHQKNRELDEVV